jgi:predicted nucleotidyltransferase
VTHASSNSLWNALTPSLNIQARHLRLLNELIAAHAPDAEVWAFGSRVTGEAQETSDLDLVFRNPEDPGAPQKNLARLATALSESTLPFSVDLLDWVRLPPEFRQEIERHYVLLSDLTAS